MRRQRLIVLLIAPCLISGCGDKEWPYEMATVTGTVKFADGSEAKGDVFTIRFVPDGIKSQGKFAPKPATGEIKEGNFALKTDTRDGAIVGKYTVEIVFVKKYPAKEERFTPTPGSVEVESGGSTFEFTITKQKKKRRSKGRQPRY